MKNKELLKSISIIIDKKMSGFDVRLNKFDDNLSKFDVKLNKFDVKLNKFDVKLNKFDEKLNGLEERIIGLEGTVSVLDGKIIGLEEKVTNLEQNTKEQFNFVNKRMDDIEVQIKDTEQHLSCKIDVTEKILLDEIERVHEILDDHINNKAMHTA